MEKKRIEKLYELLERNNLDDETIATLKWAIFELENIFCDIELDDTPFLPEPLEEQMRKQKNTEPEELPDIPDDWDYE